jgi:peptide/nickel transport system substrate-binding protein
VPAADRPFVVALDSAPSQLDPRFSTDAYSERIGHLLFSALIRVDPQGEIVSDLAKRWDIEDNRRYTFYLKENILFHDGRTLTSEDIRYTYESILNPERASPFRKMYEVIQKIETPDPATIRFILKEPNAPFLISLTRGILPTPIANKEAEDTASGPIVSEDLATSLIGSGPFSFVSYAPDDAVTLRAFPRYFDTPPQINRLVFRIIPDDSTRFLELTKGNIDLLQNIISPDTLPLLKKNAQLKVIQGPSTTYSYMGFNLSDPALKKQKVREAIAHAIDRDKIAQYIFRGTVRTASGLLTDRHWAYTPTKGRPYDLARAKQLLDEAHLYPDPSNGHRFRLTYKTSQNEVGRRVAEVIQAELAKVGIAVMIRSFEWGTFYADIQSGNFQMFSLSWVGVNDPDFYFDLFHSQSMPPNGANRVRYQNKRIDDLLELGRTLLQIDQRKAVYEEIQEILARELPYISLWHLENFAVMKKEVQGYTLYENGDFYSLKDARLSP